MILFGIWIGHAGNDVADGARNRLAPCRIEVGPVFLFPGAGLEECASTAAVGKPMDLKTERDITTGTIRKARLLLPFQNLPILKQYFNILESEIEEAYNLPSQQPRRKRD